MKTAGGERGEATGQRGGPWGKCSVARRQGGVNQTADGRLIGMRQRIPDPRSRRLPRSGVRPVLEDGWSEPALFNGRCIFPTDVTAYALAAVLVLPLLRRARRDRKE